MGTALTTILAGLNDSQQRAVTTIDGPLLIVAGPGTGKTLTIVRRIAFLIHQGVRPENILAVTFTNRAAREMRERTESLLGEEAKRIFIGTLHALGLRIMKEISPEVFTLSGRDGQIAILKPLVQGSARKARQTAERISRIKNSLENGDEKIRALYTAYQARLEERHALDFDDLIRVPAELLGGRGPNGFRNRFTHIIVDEYQDINPAQYRLLQLLTKSSQNFCAIGDSDQAIYGFRGADAGAFLSFGMDFQDAGRITLDENYRSTHTVLSAASSLIKNNQRRIEKEIVPTRERGRPVSIVSAPDERAESEFIVREIEARIGGTSHDRMRHTAGSQSGPDDSCSFSDFAVIYRTNAQAKAVEEAFLASGIPYQVIGRKSSLQSREIAEVVSYLRSLAGTDLDVSLRHSRESGNPVSSKSSGCRIKSGMTDKIDSDENETVLLTEADFFDPRANAVTLSTLHTAKGLEFRVVFITGVEEGLVPLTVTRDDVDIEEERRLFYVGMTRAKNELLFLHARNRFLYGQRTAPSPSPFLAEIPGSLIDTIVIPDRIKKQKDPDRQMGLF